MKKKQLMDLQQRAKKIFNDIPQPESMRNKTSSQLIEELMLHKIELQTQNEDLLKTQIDLIETKNKYIELYDLSPIGYFCLDENALIKEINQSGCELLGLDKYSLINRNFARYVAAEDQLLFAQYRKQAFKERTLQSYEVKLQTWNHSSFFASLHCKVVQNQTTRVKQLLVFVVDITHRARVEKNLHAKRIKMAAIDRIYSLNENILGMTDDQNHAITIINNYLQGCIHRLESGGYDSNELLTALKKTLTQVGSLDQIIRERTQSLAETVFQYEKSDINIIINQTMVLLSQEFTTYPVSIQYDLINTELKVKLDISHIQQAILNIIRNAFEAMRDANTIEPKLLIETSITLNNMAKVAISDNGPGIAMSQELITQLFEPHFTTKSYSIGLGLSVSKSIIEKHGGQLGAAPNPFGGACFSFTLPCYY